jgi:ATP/ADP translocase
MKTRSRVFGTFNFAFGTVSFLLQLLVTGPALRRFGIAVTVLVLPMTLGLGTALIVLWPFIWTVLFTNAADQGFRFSLDKASYELLYLPIAPAQRVPLKGAIDIFVNRIADACGAILLGLVTKGFAVLGIPGLGFELRGTAAINLVMIAAWIGVAWRLRADSVRTIHDSIHRHRLDTERAASLSSSVRPPRHCGRSWPARSGAGALRARSARGAAHGSWQPALRELSRIPRLTSGADRWRCCAPPASEIGPIAVELLRDRDLGVRTEALLC